MAPKAVLVGMPGSGKSTIGRRLAKALQVPMLDTDAKIVETTGRSIADIFAEGEPVFRKIEVNGDNADPLYRQLKAQAPGLLGSESVKWNFTKFLVNREGEAVERFAPTVKPEDIAPKIAKLLSE